MFETNSSECEEISKEENCIKLDDRQDFMLPTFDVTPRLFCCSGEVSAKNLHFNNDSFIASNEVLYFNELYTSINNFDDTINIELFGRKYNSGSVILNDLTRLLNLAKQNSWILLRQSKLQSTRLESIQMNDHTNYFTIRKEISSLLYYIRHFLIRSWQNFELSWIVDPLLEQLECHLQHLNSYKIILLPDFVINHAASKMGNASKHPSYHLFHCYLEIKWFSLSIRPHIRLYRQTRDECLLDMTDIQLDENGINSGISLFDNELLFLLADLVGISLETFKKANRNELKFCKPYNCVCVKELWLLIQFYVEKHNAEGKCKTFWELLNIVLMTTDDRKNQNMGVNPAYLLNYKGSDVPIFRIWIVCHISYLQGYNEMGVFIGTQCKRIAANYISLTSNLSEWLQSIETSTENANTEVVLRALLPSITDIVIHWWEPRSDPIFTLWDYFQKRLNSPFYVLGAPPQSMAIVCKSAASFLSQLKSRIKQHKPHHSHPVETSFSMFLQLLGLYLRDCFENNKIYQWEKLKGRIYPKFLPNKLCCLNETGLYHFASLFLTMAMTSKLQEVGSKLQTLLSELSFPTDTNRQSIILCTNLVLLNLYIENGINIREASKPLLAHLKQIETEESKSKYACRRMIVDGIIDVIESSKNLDFGEECLIDTWVGNFLDSKECNTVYEMVRVIMSKLRIKYAIQMSAPESCETQFNNMTQKLLQHLLPPVKRQAQLSVTSYLLGDVAASLTLLCLDDPATAAVHSTNFISLFKYFISTPEHNVRFLSRYLNQILMQEESITALSQSGENYYYLLVQAWLNCSLSTTDEMCQELIEITHVIIKIPEIIAICPEMLSIIETSDPVHDFFHILGTKFDLAATNEDKQTIRLFLIECLAGINERILCLLKKTPTTESSIIRIYSVISHLFYYCASIIYVSNKASCFLHKLTTLMLLPAPLYMGNKLHSFCVAALRKTWYRFFLGIWKKEKDLYIEQTLKDLVLQYIPYFVPKSGVITLTSPFLQIFDNNFDETLVVFVLDAISIHVLCNKSKIPHINPNMALQIFMEMFQNIQNKPSALGVFLRGALRGIFEQMLVETTIPNKLLAKNLLNQLFASDTYQQNTGILSCEITAHLTRLVRDQLMVNSANWMRFLMFLATKCPQILLDFELTLETEISNVERLRGVGHDGNLRKQFSALSSTIYSNL